MKNEVHVPNHDDYALSKHSSLTIVLGFTDNEPEGLYTIGSVSLLGLTRCKDSTTNFDTHKELVIDPKEAETLPILAGKDPKNRYLQDGDRLFALPLTSVGRRATSGSRQVRQLMPRYMAEQLRGNSEVSGLGNIEEIRSHLRNKTAGKYTPNGKKEKVY
jgi:hypothetical protein